MSSVPNVRYNVSVDDVQQKLGFNDDELHFYMDNGKQDTWKISDVIGIEDQAKETGACSALILHIIQEAENHKLIDKAIKVEAEKTVCVEVTQKLTEKINKVSCRPKNLLVLINPVGGSQTGEQQYQELVAPLFKLAKIQTDVIVSERPRHFLDVMSTYDISKINGIVICGGDGTVNECIRCIFKRTQEEAGIDYNNPDSKAVPLPVPIGQIPTGTGNGLAEMGCGVRDIVTSALHVIRGLTYNLNIHGVYCGNKLVSYYVILMMFGAWSDLFNFIEGHRWLKTMRYLILPFYHFLFKRQPCYDVEIELYRQKRHLDSQNSNKCNASAEDDKENTDTIEDQVTNMLMMNYDCFTEDFYYAKGKKKRNFDCTVVNIYKPCWRTQLLSQLLQFLLRRDPDTFIKDFIRNERVTGFKVKIHTNEHHNNQQPITLNLDGEAIQLTKPEFEVRLLGRILPLFSSRNIM